MKKKNNNLLLWCQHNGEFGKMMISEWTGLDENNVNHDINEITKGSHIRMKWLCPICNYEWVVDVHNRTGYKTGCPACAEKDRSNRTTKATTIKGKNDLLTWCNQHKEYGKLLIEEFTGKLLNGEIINISEIAKGSSKKVLWKCTSCNEIWPCSPGSRTGKNKTGCPNCNTRSTSYAEQFLYNALKEIYPDCISRGKYQNYEYDIMIPSQNTFIEYSTSFTHKGKEERDNYKAKLCEDNDIRFIKIFEDTFEERKHYMNPNDICFVMDYRNQDSILIDITKFILETFNIDDISKIDFENISELAFLRSHGKIEYKDSLEYIYPELALEWNREFNNIRTPDKLTPYASELVYWKCPNCNYGTNGEWKSILSNRSHLKQGCPACGYNWADKKVHPSSTSIVIKGKTDFPSVYPNLFKEWNSKKNKDVDPYTLRIRSHKGIYWLCRKCGYGDNEDWIAKVDQRTGQKTGCPACGYNCFDDTYHITSGTNAVVTGKTDLQAKYPNLAKEWHLTLNGELKPFQIKSKSSKPIKCECPNCKYGKDGEWIVRVGDRVQYKSGCPVCGYNWAKEEVLKNATTKVVIGVNDIASSNHFRILEEWNYKLNSIKPSEVRVSSHKPKIYWECKKCHYGVNGEWFNSLNSRTNQKSGCPVCGYNYYDDTFHKTTGRSIVAQGINDLATIHKKLAEEWHPTLNGELMPTQIKAGTHKDVYWQCPKCYYGKNGEWNQKVHTRTQRKNGCKNCGYNWYKDK